MLSTGVDIIELQRVRDVLERFEQRFQERVFTAEEIRFCRTRLSELAVRFAAKVLTGLPSILAGVFAFAVVVVMTGQFSAPAGGVALALLMLPTILLTAEEAIKRWLSSRANRYRWPRS